jgi:hypothetical protein
MVGVASAGIATERHRHFRVAGVVGDVQHELAQGSEVTLDAIQMTCGGWRWHQFDIVRLCPFADRRCPVQRQIVIDQVEPGSFANVVKGFRSS